MGELTVTGLDEAVLARLSSRAAAHGRSVEAEASAILQQEFAHPSNEAMSEQEWGALAAESRRLSGQLAMRTIDLLHESREERMDALCSSS